MTKYEFLEELKAALTGEVESQVMLESYSYYSNYIDNELRKGRLESEILEELGKPNLIARSIIAANAGERMADVEYTEDGRTRKVHNNVFREKLNEAKEEKVKKPFVFDFTAWYAKILYVLIILLLILIVFFILKVGLWIIITFGVPLLLLLGIIYLIMYFLR